MDEMKEILVIDDDAAILESIKKQLKNESLNLELVDDPIRGLERIMTNNFDLILCDIRMKSLNGLEVLRRIKSSHPEIPVIMLTGYVDNKMIEEAYSLGCIDFLIKPIRKNFLIEHIKKVFI